VNFETDAERGLTPLPGEHPDYMLGQSAYDSLENARAAWARFYESRVERNKGKPVQMRVGHFIAELELDPADGIEIDAPLDAEPRGHVWIKGDKHRLAASFVEIYAAKTNDD
jgi:hypothetical protein